MQLSSLKNLGTGAFIMQRGFEHMNGNACLVNGYCHLVNKTLFFIQKYFEGIIPAGRPDQEIYWKTKAVYEQIRELLDGGREEEVRQILQGYLEFATAYFEQGEPWKTRERIAAPAETRF